ncbi:MAG: hypothetical protein INR69_22060, partial [Mucilaginibacter polytrichastri]|nr:hypothetical protein [Mucilaginibacter polytrichastri]
MTILPGSLSLWWLLPALVVSAGLAWLLYGKSSVLAKRWQYLLFVFRTVVFTIIFLLLLAPLIRMVSKRLEKPLIILAQDNSASLKQKTPGFDQKRYQLDLEALQKALADKYEVDAVSLGNGVQKGLRFDQSGKATDLSALFAYIRNTWPARNIGAVVLASDGIYNRGADPVSAAEDFRGAVYTVALGDTTARRDLAITQLNYNQVAFSGDDFEIEVLAEANRSKGSMLLLSAKTDDGQQVQKQVSITADPLATRIPLRLSAQKPGSRKIIVGIKPLDGEVTTANNTQTIYVDVLDGKRKVLILSASPHPDVAVLKQAIESNKNYQVKTATFAAWQKQKPDFNPELLILHQLPAAGMPVNAILQNYPKKPVWYITGMQSDLPALNSAQQVLMIVPATVGAQEVFGQVIPEFSQFTISDSLKMRVQQFPPMLSVYGNFGLGTNASVFMQQRIGRVETKNALFAFGQGNPPVAVLAAEGLWRWRLAEYQQYGNSSAVNELVSQTVQYLTTQSREERFRIIPSKTRFDEGEQILLNAELYNDANELINTPDVRIDLKNTTQKKQYGFQFSRDAKSYTLNA